MYIKRFFPLGIVFCGFLFLQGQSASDSIPVQQFPEEASLMSLSLQVKSALNESRQQTLLLESKLDSLQQKLTISEQQLDLSLTELTELTSSLNSTKTSFTELSEALDKSNIQLELEKARVASRNRILLIAGILFLINLAAKGMAFVLMSRGIVLPRWLDILI